MMDRRDAEIVPIRKKSTSTLKQCDNWWGISLLDAYVVPLLTLGKVFAMVSEE